MASDAEVITFVRNTRGAVGYVSSVPRDKTVNVISKF
jgi:hypothetical protein